MAWRNALRSHGSLHLAKSTHIHRHIRRLLTNGSRTLKPDALRHVAVPNGWEGSAYRRNDGKMLMQKFRRFRRSVSGATAIEYGLIAAGIAVAIIAIVNTLGSQIAGIFTTISTQLK